MSFALHCESLLHCCFFLAYCYMSTDKRSKVLREMWVQLGAFESLSLFQIL